MWIAKGRDKPSQQHFDAHYVEYRTKNENTIRGDCDRIQDVLKLTGSLDNLRVLDLGSAGLMASALKSASKAVLVDLSPVICDMVSEMAPWCTVVCQDAVQFLKCNFDMFDVTICQGLLSYLLPEEMEIVFDLAPSPVLMVGVEVAESYLQYPARIAVPSREDISDISSRYGWKKTKDLELPSHVWARFER